MTINTMDDNLIEKSIIDSVAQRDDAFFCHQQLQDPDLSLEERKTIVKNLIHSNHSLFLERYGRFLDENQLNFFEKHHIGVGDSDVGFQLNALRMKLQQTTRGSLIRNRRYQALQNLLKDGQYFSDSEMQSRSPYLFEQMIGRYMNEEEKKNLQRANYLNNYGAINFSSFIFENIRQACMNRISSMEENQFREEDDEEDSADEDDGKESKQKDQNISAEEKETLRNEFVDLMKQNFLNGKDGEHFDYGPVDNDDNYDLNVEHERDLEEAYFDTECK